MNKQGITNSVFLQADDSAHVLVLSNIKYAVTSRLFSKWDKAYVAVEALLIAYTTNSYSRAAVLYTQVLEAFLM